MCEYGFADGKSYWTFLSDRSDGLPGKQPTDHALTISMTKEICMLQRSSKGKECREYFISCEDAWNSPDKIMERALQIAHQHAVERAVFEKRFKHEIGRLTGALV
jgi:anti-repressor protein